MKTIKHLLPVLCCVFIASAIVFFHSTRTSSIDFNGVFASPSEIDFGQVHDVDSVKKQFTIINNSDKSVEIVDIKVSCGCTKIDMPNRHILPHQSIIVAMESDLKGSYGYKEFEAILITNHEATPLVRLSLVGTVSTTQLAGIIPFDIGVFAPAEIIDESIVLYQKILNPHVVLTNVSNKDLEQTTISSKIEDDTTRLFICGTAPSQSGEFHLSATINADGPFWKQTNITVTGTVLSPWELAPVIYLGFVSPQQQAKKTIKLKRLFYRQTITEQSIGEVKIISKNTALKKKIIYIGVDEIIFELELSHLGYNGSFVDDIEIRFMDAGKEYISCSTVKASFL